MERLGGVVARHARATLAGWVVLVVLCFGAALGLLGNDSLSSRLTTGEAYVYGESHTGSELLADAPGAGESAVVRVDHVPVTDPAVQTTAATVRNRLTASPGVAGVIALTAPPDSLAYVVRVTGDLSGARRLAVVDAAAATVRTGFAPITGASVHEGGQIPLTHAVTHQVESDLRRGEGIALPLSLAVMVVIFGGFIAAGIPIVGAIAAIGGGLAALLGFAGVMDLEAAVVNIVTLLGLGLCIDYGLLMVSRFREEVGGLAPTAARHELTHEQIRRATVTTVATAGRTIVFSALTVAISIAGMVLFPSPTIRAVGVAGLSVVLVALLVAITLVPALCAVAGRRIVRRAVHDSTDEGFFARLARFVQRHHRLVVVGVIAGLLALAAPLLGMRQVSSAEALLPAGTEQRVVYEQIQRDFPALREPAVTVVARATPQQATAWIDRIRPTLPAVTSVDPARDIGNGYVAVGIRADTATPTNDVGADLVTAVRAHRPSFDTWVTGSAAKVLDYDAGIRERAPLVIGVVALATIVLLFLMTGSLALPLKALVFNALSLAASLGALTLIFEGTALEGPLAFTSTGGVETLVPVIMLAFGFGLAMDYEVFLLSRIVELHEHGASDAEAVVKGVQRSGKIITSAALLILIVLAGFAAAEVMIIKQVGTGLAISILLDATIVRMLLVPATMTLLGGWNWWAPGWMRRLHTRYGIHDA